MEFGKICTFATESSFPKRETFLNVGTQKFSKTDNFEDGENNKINKQYNGN